MRILIVEDEKDIAQLLKTGLEEENHVVDMAFDGISGLELAQAINFDVIILDVMLPKRDGFEVAQCLRAKGNHTPILMLTARDTVPDVSFQGLRPAKSYENILMPGSLKVRLGSRAFGVSGSFVQYGLA